MEFISLLQELNITGLTEVPHVGPNGKSYKDTVNDRIKNVYDEAIKKGLSKDKITEKVV